MLAAVIPIVTVAIRYIIIAAVQLGIWTLIEKYALPVINNAIIAIMQKFGVSEDQAKDIMANDIIEFAESIGVFAVTLKTKMPLKVAELLGFTTKGWSKRVLVSKVSKLATTSTAAVTTLVKGAPVIEKAAAPAIINAAKSYKPGFKIAYDLVMKTLGVTFVGTLAVSNVIDFGNWNSGAYQKKMQKVIEFLSLGTLTPDADYRTSRTLSPDIFDKIYNTYKIEGAQYINDPYKKQHVLFTRDNMLDFLDVIGAELVRMDGSASTKEVNLAALPFIIFDVSEEVQAVKTEIEEAQSTTQIKVFTGVVTQGKLGNAAAFVSRESDLISNMSELQRAAENNLASFIVALPSKIIYEIKIVSSVTSKDGFTQRGTTQKVVTGYYANGTPKYKTITNKFAQLKVYVLTDKGTRTTISTITLGPVNSAEFVPSAAELGLAEQEIKNNITTTDVTEITAIETTQPISVEEVQQATPTLGGGLKMLETQFYIARNPNNGEIVYIGTATGGIYGIPTEDIITLAKAQEYVKNGTRFEPNTGPTVETRWTKEDLLSGAILNSGMVERYTTPGGQVLTNVPLKTVQQFEPNIGEVKGDLPGSSNANRCSAINIADYYGGQIPSELTVAARSKLYESWGLGSAAYYTGTAEQNNRLLAEMKRRSGC